MTRKEGVFFGGGGGGRGGKRTSKVDVGLCDGMQDGGAAHKHPPKAVVYRAPRWVSLVPFFCA